MIPLVLSLWARPGRAEDLLLRLEEQQQALFAGVHRSVVFIGCGEGFGSGFFVNDKGLILTSNHVVRGTEPVKVVQADGKVYAGRVVARGLDKIDLALVQIETKQPTPALRLAGYADLQVGSWVGSVGHGRGGIWSYNTGMVSNIYPVGEERPVFQTQIPLNPGGSGGPVIDRKGLVVGIVTAGIEGANSINFAIRSDIALRALPLLADPADQLLIEAPAGVAVFVDGKMVGTGPRVRIPASQRTYQVFAVINGVMKRVQVSFPVQRTVELK